MDYKQRRGRSRSPRDRENERNNMRENYNSNDSYSRGPRRSRSRDKSEHDYDPNRNRKRISSRSRSPPHQRSRIDGKFKDNISRTMSDNKEYDRNTYHKTVGNTNTHDRESYSRNSTERSSRDHDRGSDARDRHEPRGGRDISGRQLNSDSGRATDDHSSSHKRNIRIDEGTSRYDSHNSRNKDRNDPPSSGRDTHSTAKKSSMTSSSTSTATASQNRSNINSANNSTSKAPQDSSPTTSNAAADALTAANTRANTVADIVYNEDDLKNIDAFLEFGGGLGDEEEEQREAERLAAERRKRLEAIANKHKLQQQTEKTTSPKAVTSLQRKHEDVDGDDDQSAEVQPPAKRKVSLGSNVLELPAEQVAAAFADTARRDRASSNASGLVSDEEGHSNLTILDGISDDGIVKPASTTTSAAAVTGTTAVSLEHLALDDHQLMQRKSVQLAELDTSEEAVGENFSSAAVPSLPSVSFNSQEDDDEGRQLAKERTAVEEEARKNAANNYFAFDIFSSSPSDLERLKASGGNAGAAGRKHAQRDALLPGNYAPEGGKGPPGMHDTTSGTGEGDHHHLQSNWDDGEGYYKARIGEVIGERFHTLGVVGKGVFSTVLKCVDLRTGDGKSNFVAIKLIRNNDTMRKAAEKEKSILLNIIEKDPDNRRFCVRMLTHLDYRSHVALVFEYQQMNLREALKKFGKDVGINIGAVRMYGKQLMIALRLLMELQVVHADIKLDNILCSGDLKTVKLCDFGSAFRETDTDNDPTPYLVSRFYRAPEIILGMPYDRAIDLWSVCVCLYELFTGHVMFAGRTNNEMLRLNMAVKGRFPNKLIKAHIRQYEMMSLEPHFDQDCRFKHYEADSITGKTVLRLVDVTGPTRDLETVLRGSKAGADDIKLVAQLTDLLEKGLTLDPSKRLTVSDALKHPFFMSARAATTN